MKKFWKIALIVVPAVVVAGTATFLLIYKYKNTKSEDGEKSIVVEVPNCLLDGRGCSQPVEPSEKINKPEIISSSHNPQYSNKFIKRLA
ncbi:hypothetical protein Q4504_01865 [Mesomycoplasma ovipneumoniae]|uniref:hypothetical protein n=1 Tax=Mesomycoplasma ovipneumoniae TaxID=29562 RepID=UPI0026E14180|nr:hypothetical protein [Mesomycoplasma ovipneumoniae]MDO6857206.1 hypothetical protein [Mesomycoplasma ovipneumoniae]MDW2924043.1 hypothetical protein [Mesomycoplasma ovipneumoniae]MDW2931630.1 hypothetical protein [Mesomycoplasma ovipneumoniae]